MSIDVGTNHSLSAELIAVVVCYTKRTCCDLHTGRVVSETAWICITSVFYTQTRNYFMLKSIDFFR